MFNVRRRFTSQGITWEQLAFQFLVVLLGVYLAVSFERKAEERGRQGDAIELLGHLLDELVLDEADFRVVASAQAEIRVALDSLGVLLAIGSDSNAPQIDSLLYGPLLSLVTAFPRRAAYSAMVSGGYLTAIPDQELTVKLANLYEHSYPRLVHNGEYFDQWGKEAFFVLGDYWDLEGRVFLRPGVNGTAPLRNAVRNFRDMGDFYALILGEAQVNLMALREDVESYLGR